MSAAGIRRRWREEKRGGERLKQTHDSKKYYKSGKGPLIYEDKLKVSSDRKHLRWLWATNMSVQREIHAAGH